MTGTVARWSLALLLTGVAGWIWLVLNPILSERYPLLPFYPAVFVVAWYAGLGPGVLATFLGASIVALFSFPGSGSALGGSQFGLAAFLSIGLSTSGFGPLYRRADAYLTRAGRRRAGAERQHPGRGDRLPAGSAALVAAVSIAVFGGMVYAAGARAGFFEPSETLHARFASADGLRVEAPVWLAGVPVGRVLDVAILPAGVRVDLRVPRRYGARIHRDSVARIEAEQVLGRKCIEITPGSEDVPPLADDDELATSNPTEVAALVDQAGQALHELEQTAENLHRITTQVTQGRGTLGAVVENRDLYDETVELVERTRSAVQKLESRAESSAR